MWSNFSKSPPPRQRSAYGPFLCVLAAIELRKFANLHKNVKQSILRFNSLSFVIYLVQNVIIFKSPTCDPQYQ